MRPHLTGNIAAEAADLLDNPDAPDYRAHGMGRLTIQSALDPKRSAALDCARRQLFGLLSLFIPALPRQLTGGAFLLSWARLASGKPVEAADKVRSFGSGKLNNHRQDGRCA